MENDIKPDDRVIIYNGFVLLYCGPWKDFEWKEHLHADFYLLNDVEEYDILAVGYIG